MDIATRRQVSVGIVMRKESTDKVAVPRDGVRNKMHMNQWTLERSVY